jgi:hypothetical protein
MYRLCGGVRFRECWPRAVGLPVGVLVEVVGAEEFGEFGVMGGKVGLELIACFWLELRTSRGGRIVSDGVSDRVPFDAHVVEDQVNHGLGVAEEGLGVEDAHLTRGEVPEPAAQLLGVVTSGQVGELEELRWWVVGVGVGLGERSEAVGGVLEGVFE